MRTIQAVGLIAVVATMFGLDLSASAESPYPNRPIHVVVPYPAGGIVDIVARAVTEQVGRDWKAAVVRIHDLAPTAISVPPRSRAAIPTATPGW
jgi:tripartite-type tricarboxylate transporter receptor subunit TctC